MELTRTITALVDDLGDLKAEIAPMTKAEKALKAELIATGETAVEGERYRASVSHSTAVGLDAEKARAFLDGLVADGVISRQKREALNKRTDRTTVRVTAMVRA